MFCLPACASPPVSDTLRHIVFLRLTAGCRLSRACRSSKISRPQTLHSRHTRRARFRARDTPAAPREPRAGAPRANSGRHTPRRGDRTRQSGVHLVGGVHAAAAATEHSSPRAAPNSDTRPTVLRSAFCVLRCGALELGAGPARGTGTGGRRRECAPAQSGGLLF